MTALMSRQWAGLERCESAIPTWALRNEGFSLVELVAVITILGILTATALPRFVDLSEDAHLAVMQSIGASMRSGVVLTHAGWIAKGASDAVDVIEMEGANITVTSNGWPENNGSSAPNDTITADECVEVWNVMMTHPPSISTGTGLDYQATVSAPRCIFTYQAKSDYVIYYNSSTGDVQLSAAAGGSGC